MLNRYKPQTRIKEIGNEGQTKLKNATILVVGCGALGSPLAMYLAGAGLGTLIIADFDTVDVSNLHRQVFYSENEIGKPKVDLLKAKIESLNSEIKVIGLNSLITAKQLKNIGFKLDLIADCADNPATTYLLDEYCNSNEIPLSIAGVSGWEAQIFTYLPGSSRYSDFFPKPEDDSGILPCSLTGITGPTAAFASSLQASEIMKFILGIGNKKQRFIKADLLNSNFTVMNL